VLVNGIVLFFFDPPILYLSLYTRRAVPANSAAFSSSLRPFAAATLLSVFHSTFVDTEIRSTGKLLTPNPFQINKTTKTKLAQIERGISPFDHATLGAESVDHVAVIGERQLAQLLGGGRAVAVLAR